MKVSMTHNFDVPPKEPRFNPSGYDPRVARSAESCAMELTLRRTVIGGDRTKDDYCVVFEGRAIGRIRCATERIGHNPGWDWGINPPMPIPTWCNGSEPDLERAKAAFREAWERFYATLSPDDIARWHAAQDASERRWKRT